MPIFIFTKERRKKLIKLKDTYEKIFETVWHNYTCGDVELNLLHFEFPVHAKKAELLEIYAKLVKTINGDDVVYLTNIQKFVRPSFHKELYSEICRWTWKIIYFWNSY